MQEMSARITLNSQDSGDYETSAGPSRTLQAAIDHSYQETQKMSYTRRDILTTGLAASAGSLLANIPLTASATSAAKKTNADADSSQACSANVELPENGEYPSPVA